MLETIERKPILSIFLIVVTMLGFSIDYLPVSIMEARNFITAREMVIDGNWLLTTMNGLARYEKPPLPTWLTACFGMLCGIKNLLALRLPAILCVALAGIGIYKVSFNILEHKLHSFYNALIGVTSFYVIGIVIEAPWDIYTHAFMLISIYYLFQLFRTEQNLKYSVLAGSFMGLSILCKGPISIYALLLPFLIAYGFVYGYRLNRTKIGSIFMSIIIALCIGGWWYFYVRINDPETFLAIAQKETGNWSSYNVKPFYYYWSFFTQSGIWTIPAFIALLYPYMKSRVSNLRAYHFSLLWTLTAVVLLSLIPEKKSRYLMPVLIPMAINTGFYIEYLIRSFKTLNDKRETFPVYFNFGLIALIGLAFPLVGFFIAPQLNGVLLFWFALASLALFGIGLFILIQLKSKNIKLVFYSCIGFIAAILIAVLPLTKTQVASNYHPISSLSEEASQQGLKVYSFSTVAPEMIWQFGDKIPELKNEDNQIHLPNETKFGMLATSISPEDQNLLNANYHIELITTYDLNRADQDSRQYNGRLFADYYILIKK
ncbi:ArnT family glycosyltransferase [Geojedonia litorea]|uniref:ArnT family glycosyltransferase n=1 Tax=Geojedonia litorea TaxID=1268269 RepID=A0ABV9N3H9_9FLAO